MSNSSRLLLITVPWRKVCAALPAVALLAAGIAVSAPVAPGQNVKVVAVTSESPVIVVPDTALNLPAPAGVSTENLPLTGPEAPAPVVSKSPVLVTPSFATPSHMTLDSTGIPVRALEGYRRAALLVSPADRACHVDWALLAAIGRVESNHARFGGNQLDAAGVAQPGIIGIPLDGTNETARITDSDGGLLDRDSVFDRAVGPMQFIPSTWRAVAVDADGDGVANPQDMIDAASAAAIYLCSGPGDLSIPGELYAAIMRYNASDSYVRTVTALAATYRLGVSALPSQEPTLAATPSTTTGQPGPVLTTMLRQPAVAVGSPRPTPLTSAPALTTLRAPVPTTSTPAPILNLTATAPAPTPDPTATATATAPAPTPDPTATATATAPAPTPDPTATATAPATTV